MGIILIPMFLAMVLGFSYPGIRLGGQAVVRAGGRVTAGLLLVGASAGLSLVSVALPLALVVPRRVSAGGFVMIAAWCVAGIAGVAGIHLKNRFRVTGRPVAGLLGAACFLAAAGFPLVWFWLGERLAKWFQISWIY
jgi:hypothetical protein